MRENTTPSNRVLPKYPSLIRHVTKASHCPVVGSALNWQGQPQLQLQLENSSPTIRHLICVGSPIFRCFKELHSGWVTRNTDPCYIALWVTGLQDLSQVH